MREIKFRAWDKIFKEMGNVACLNLSEFSTDHIIKNKSHPNFYNQTFNNLILMQYTGLKDVHGKEIYEGDIIIELYDGKPKHSIPSNCIVEWGFHSDHSSYMYQLGWNLWEEEEYKVVGNIYENPELLRNDHLPSH